MRAAVYLVRIRSIREWFSTVGRVTLFWGRSGQKRRLCEAFVGLEEGALG